jgi:2-polyprenyl-3-methyl-5-hydroxy-6-metoxy-1,4-benzoquinol methylase
MLSARLLSNKFKSRISRFITPKVPARLSSKFIKVDPAGMDEIATSLKQHYFSLSFAQERQAQTPEIYLASAAGRDDLTDHLHGRLDNFRHTVVPWLNDAHPLLGASILEIGCGTGSSTVALVEQGAQVMAVDIDEESLAVAKDRCRVYGLSVDFCKANATEVHTLFAGRHFDFVIFFAALEHMTHDERMIAMEQTWHMLSRGDLWGVIETPNRLWYFDGHTSFLPFYLWLPDDLAFKYSRFSPRQSFCGSYREYKPSTLLHFLRRGRGVSFHEFDLAMKKAEELDVISSLPLYLRKKSLLREIGWRQTLEYRYESLLVAAGPAIHRGFYQPGLDLIIRKD